MGHAVTAQDAGGSTTFASGEPGPAGTGTTADGRSLGDLVGDIATDLTTLAPVLTLGSGCGQRRSHAGGGEDDVLDGNHFG